MHEYFIFIYSLITKGILIKKPHHTYLSCQWESVGQRRWWTKRWWCMPMKLGACWKRFGTGSIDDLDMFSGMTTYLMTLLKGKFWARLLGVGKDGVSAWYDGRERLWTVERFNLWQFKMDDDDEIAYFTVCWKTRASFWRQDSKWEWMPETCWKQQKIEEEANENWRSFKGLGSKSRSSSLRIYLFYLI